MITKLALTLSLGLIVPDASEAKDVKHTKDIQNAIETVKKEIAILKKQDFPGASIAIESMNMAIDNMEQSKNILDQENVTGTK